MFYYVNALLVFVVRYSRETQMNRALKVLIPMGQCRNVSTNLLLEQKINVINNSYNNYLLVFR